jgi:hypothetical protein
MQHKNMKLMNTWLLNLQFSKRTIQAEPYMRIIIIILNYFETESRYFKEID